MQSIVEKDWLKSRLNSPDFVILDCRFSLMQPEAGEEAYHKSHIPGAFYCHLEKELSGPVLAHGGRHPLPDLKTFQSFIEGVGITNDTIVVAYDNGEGSYASRLWWLMKYIGHQEVYILNGGFRSWVEAHYPVDSTTPSKKRSATYEMNIKTEMLATYDDVKRVVEQRPIGTILIDSREEKRYQGIEEPIDRIPGRIPGAIHKFWNEGFESGFFKPTDEQKKRFNDLDEDSNLIVYCGSGVTAAPNFLVLHELGYRNLKLYIGSYSDWVSYGNNKVEKNE
jgi:thiosulfate/3-mercaptopyruvate sulfurtransferase